MTASGVSYVPAGTGTVYLGSVTGLDGSRVFADTVAHGGERLQLSFDLNIDAQRNVVTGSMSGIPTEPANERVDGSLRGRGARGREASARRRARRRPRCLGGGAFPAPRAASPERRELIASSRSSGLRGRGGGAFPTGDKLAAVAAQHGRPVIVVNATEGEPASSKDLALVGLVPHLVLDGAAAAASALGARTVVVAVARRGGAVERGILAAALRERREKLDWQLASIPDGFVAGEETALVNALNARLRKAEREAAVSVRARRRRCAHARPERRDAGASSR